ncbi:MAG: phosphoenolpyruvate synthase, partial [Halothiobacillaceae bacterium]
MSLVVPFSSLSLADVPRVGGKNASLGEMVSRLGPRGVSVPDGFATTAEAFWHFLDSNNLRQRIIDRLSGLDVDDTRALVAAGQDIRDWINAAVLPQDLVEAISAQYEALCREYDVDEADVAVRSSATAEDLPTASFAGQQETYLNVRGRDHLLTVCRQVLASLYTNRAIAYRVHHGFDHDKVALSIGVQKMVRSDLASAGVMFTLDTESGFRDTVLITAAYGLGENVVQGAVNPDEFLVFKPTLAEGKRPIVRRRMGEKAIRMIYAREGVNAITRNEPVPRGERHRFALGDDEILELARQAVEIEKHYSEQAGEPRPMDIEWAKDGQTGRLFIVQARPETVKSRANPMCHETFILRERGPVIVTGRAVGGRIAAGRVRVIDRAADMHDLERGEVLVTDITDPDWEPVMKRAAAIVTNRGGRTCHAAIIARELGIPAVVGCRDATERLSTGTQVTVSCAEGDTGFVYAGKRSFQTEVIDLQGLEPPQTRLMLNVANPDQALVHAALPAAGVGLARLEFIINQSIGIHPCALRELEQLPAELARSIRERIAGFSGPREFYVQTLAEGVGLIAAAFYPRPVIVRFSDFKSNEYRSLLGGSRYEPDEENPMLGLRGAARYHDESFRACFLMEVEALRRVREDMGLDNAQVMLPFVRSTDEVDKVLDLMQSQGLARGQGGLQVYLMCEIPANVILADEFLERVDGFSIGSNDLTQLTLGVDRDSGLLQGFDERNPAVIEMLRQAIAACRRRDKYVGICGQAPSDYPEITRFLVAEGIGSISLNPDSLVPMMQVVSEAEQARTAKASG